MYSVVLAFFLHSLVESFAEVEKHQGVALRQLQVHDMVVPFEVYTENLYDKPDLRF